MTVADGGQGRKTTSWVQHGSKLDLRCAAACVNSVIDCLWDDMARLIGLVPQASRAEGAPLFKSKDVILVARRAFPSHA